MKSKLLIFPIILLFLNINLNIKINAQEIQANIWQKDSTNTEDNTGNNQLTEEISNSPLKSYLSPTRILYGQAVSLVIEIKVHAKDKVYLPKIGDTLSHHLEILDKKIDTVRNADSITYIEKIDFSSYEKGLFIVPPISVYINNILHRTQYYHLEVDEVKIDTLNYSLFDIKPIYIEPLTFKDYINKYWFYLLIFSLFIIILIALIYFYSIERKKKKIINRIERIDEVILKKINDLKNHNYIENNEYKKYYSTLDNILREYLYYRWNFPADKFFSIELVKYISKNHYITDEQLDKIANFLYTSELVKFAKSTPSKSDCQRHMEDIIEFIKDTKPEFENIHKNDE